MKKFLTVTLLIAVFVLSCDNGGGGTPVVTPTDDPNEVKDRTTTVSLFGGLSTVTVKGNLTKPQLDDSASKIAGKLNDFYNNNPADHEAIIGLFARGVTYIVEATPNGYENFKTIGDGKTVYIPLDKLDTNCVEIGLVLIYRNEAVVSKVTPTANNKGVNV